MAEQRSRDNWQMVSTLLAMIHNMHLARKADAKPASYFNPYASSSTDTMEINRNEAKDLFTLIAKKCGGSFNSFRP